MNNLYLVSQSKNNDYDTYDSFVVVAEGPHKAALISPDDSYPHWDSEVGKWYSVSDIGVFRYQYNGGTWTSPENVEVWQIGTTQEELGKVLISSFNAG